jgi:hypothetical protein
MLTRDEIKSDKVLVKRIFKEMWFQIPEYQRPYVWEADQVRDLLDDLSYAMSEKPTAEYFLGSFVFQQKPADPAKGQQFDESDLLDGQQRMATVLMLLAVLRDLTNDDTAKKSCQESIYQQSDPYKHIPERVRIVFATREAAQDFLAAYIMPTGGTKDETALAQLSKKGGDLSAQNMANAVLEMRKFFQDNPTVRPEALLEFLLNNVLLIYVSTESLDDAFRLFTILNNRGVPLRNSDILKSINLGVLDKPAEKIRYAKMWEEAESALGEDFDRFLNHVRTILVKEKARLGLLQEFEDVIYEPKECDKSTGKKKPVLLRKGAETFATIQRYLGHYGSLLGGVNSDETGSYEFDNLVKMMLAGLPATDWLPPLMQYYDRFKHARVLDFLRLLDNKFSADWLAQFTPTKRIEAMNGIIKLIDGAKTQEDVLGSECFGIDADAFLRALGGPVYKRRFTKYVLLKADYLVQTQSQRMHFDNLSAEHILPQNPDSTSQWVKDFTDAERLEWVDKLGNLVLITGNKNSSQGRLDYQEKKDKYFRKNVDTSANSLRVLQEYQDWTPRELKENHFAMMDMFRKHYGIASTA